MLDVLVLADLFCFFFLFYYSYCQLETPLYFANYRLFHISVVLPAAIFCYLKRFSRLTLPSITTRTEPQHPLHLLHPNAFIRSHLPVLRRASTRRISTFDFYLSQHRADDAPCDRSAALRCSQIPHTSTPICPW